MQSVFSRLFGATTGNISMFDPEDGIELLSRDFDSFGMFACAKEGAMLDTTTEDGEAVALFVPGDGFAMVPPPSVVFTEGGLYLNDGAPLAGQKRGQLFLPADVLGKFEDCPFYSLADLKVKEVAALSFKETSTGEVDPAMLKDKTEAEIKHLLELNDRIAFGLLGSQGRIIYQPDKSKPPKFLTVKDASEREATRIVHVKKKGGETAKLNMFKEWKEWPGRREYDEIKFAPGEDNPNLYNLFFGWDVRPQQGDWSHLRDHIRLTLCNGDDGQFQWFMTWLSHMLQFPGLKPTVAVVIRGKKGTGKSIIFDNIQRLMSGYFFKAADGKRALSNFNAQYETTLLLVMEEAFWAGDKAKEAVLKDLITSPWIPIERKGIDTYMARNFMRIAMISNDQWVVPATADERRFAVFDCGDEHRGDHAYFKALDDQMKSGGLEAMLYDLLTFEPQDGWGILSTAPATSGLKEQVIESLRGIDRFMYELLKSGMYECDGCDDGGIFLSEDAAANVNMTDLRAAARDYMVDNYPGTKAATVDMVERAVREWFDAEVVKMKIKGRTNAGRSVKFPSLADSREHIRRTKGMIIPSDNPATH